MTQLVGHPAGKDIASLSVGSSTKMRSIGPSEGASSIPKTRAYFLSSHWECTQALNQQSHTDSPPVSGCNEVIYESVLTIGLIAPMKSELALVKRIALSGNCVQDIHWRLP